MGTVTRSLYYYDLYVNNVENKNGIGITSDVEIVAFFDDLYRKQKGNSDYSKFYRHTRTGDVFFVIVDTLEKEYVEFRIVLCRSDALPYIEQDGKLDSLGNYIDPDQNIAEITHCVYFRKYGVMAGEYNFSGARPTTVADYMMKYVKGIGFVSCQAKLNYDSYSKLIAGKEFTLFDFAVKTNSDAYNNVLSNVGIFKTMQGAVPEADTMEIILKRRKTKKNRLTGFPCPLSLSQIKLLLSQYREDIEKFRVSQNAISDNIDLLSDKLVYKICVAETTDRTINSRNIYDEMKMYFNTTVINYCE